MCSEPYLNTFRQGCDCQAFKKLVLVSIEGRISMCRYSYGIWCLPSSTTATVTLSPVIPCIQTGSMFISLPMYSRPTWPLFSCTGIKAQTLYINMKKGEWNVLRHTRVHWLSHSGSVGGLYPRGCLGNNTCSRTKPTRGSPCRPSLRKSTSAASATWSTSRLTGASLLLVLVLSCFLSKR